MKLTTFFLLAAILTVSASSFAQKVTLHARNESLESVLKQLRQQTGYDYVIDEQLLNDANKVTLKLNGAELQDALKKIFANQALTYSLDNKVVTIRQKQLSFLDELKAALAAIPVRGHVIDENGQPLPGATVKVKGTPLATVTDDKGNFRFERVADDATLVISFLGYEPMEVSVKQDLTNIQLKKSNSQLNDVIVVAYGTSTRQKITSAVSTLPMETVAPIPVQSINDAVSGRIPGVLTTTTNGAPGTKTQISIRGGNTPANGDANLPGGSPLFVIDNIIRTQADFENLNPNDIDSYSVLKDAAATSLYGALGGNGVVLVTTKRGKEGEININYSYNTILSQPTIMPKKLDSYDMLSAINKIYLAEGQTQPTPDSILNYYKNQTKPFVYPNTNWQSLALKKYAVEQRHDLSLSAGSKLLTYYASGSYYNQGSDLRTDDNYNNRVTYRLNTVSNFDKIKLKVTTGLDGYVETNDQPNAGYFNIYSHIQNTLPYQQAYNNYGLPSTNTADNPIVDISSLSGYNKSSTRVFNSILGLDWETPLKDLRIKLTGNYNMNNSLSKSWSYSAPTYADNSTVAIQGNPPSLSEQSTSGNTLLLQAFLTYNKSLGDHHIDFTGGYEQAQTKSEVLMAERQQYQILFDQFVAGPTVNQIANGSEAESARAGYLGRLSYNYKLKYFLEGTLRYDANDLLPPAHRWGTFYAISGGWALTEENFMQSLKADHIFDFLKLRGDYGVTGTLDGISPFQYVAGYAINNNAWIVNGIPQQGTSEQSSLPSTSFSWYNIKSRDFGLDFASLSNHLNGTFDYYFTRTTGYVTNASSYAGTLGIGLPPVNFDAGALRKEGIEFNVSWNNRIGKDFTYKVGVNYTRYNQLWERYPFEDETALMNPYTRLSGNTLYYGQGYINEGFYQSNSELLNGARRISSVNVVAGDLKYEDVNGDGKIDASDFRNIGSTTFPHSNYGVTLDLGYKGFYLSAVVMGAGSSDRYLGSEIQGADAQRPIIYGFQENYWTPTNTNALFPRPVSSSGVNGNNNYTTSDFWLLSSSYIRLKYLQLGYDFKKDLLRKSVFKTLKLFVSGTNLLTLSKSKDYFIDPEADPNNYNYPVQRTMSLGANASF